MYGDHFIRKGGVAKPRVIEAVCLQKDVRQSIKLSQPQAASAHKSAHRGTIVSLHTCMSHDRYVKISGLRLDVIIKGELHQRRSALTQFV